MHCRLPITTRVSKQLCFMVRNIERLQTKFCSNCARASKASYQFCEPRIVASDAITKKQIENSFKILPNFIGDSEETQLYNEVHKKLKRARYEYNHWDNVSSSDLLSPLLY